MINSPNPHHLLSPSSLEKNRTDNRLKPHPPIYLKNWIVQWIMAKEMLSQFWLRRQSNIIIHDIVVNDIDDLEKSVTWSSITVPFLTIIWMYFFYRWPTHHPELFSIAIGFPICFVSFRLIQFVRKHQH